MKHLILLVFIIFGYSFEIKYKTLTTDFNQTIKSDNKTIIYKGKLFIKDNLIFWHYKKPIEKKIWVLQNKIYVYEPDLYQVTIYSKNKDDDFFNLLKTAKKIDNNLYVKKYNDKTIYFSIKNGLVKKIYYKDKIDNLVTLNFYNTNKGDINKSLFKPSFESDVDIIYSK